MSDAANRGEKTPQDTDGSEPDDNWSDDGATPDVLEVFGSAPLVREGADLDDMTSTELAAAMLQTPEPGGVWDLGDEALKDELADDEPKADEPEPAPAEPAPAEQPVSSKTGARPATPEAVAAAATATVSFRPGDKPGGNSVHDLRLVELVKEVRSAIQRGQRQMKEQLSATNQRLDKLERSSDGLTKQTSFLPPKLRGLGQKVEDLSKSLADARCRAVLTDVLGLGDLVTAALASLADTDSEPGATQLTADSRRYFVALETRIGQILEANQLHEIPTDVAFDPSLHQAIESVPVFEPEEDGRIVEVFRRGFQTDQSVLRYAEVAVGRLNDRRLLPGSEAQDGPLEPHFDEGPQSDDPLPEQP